MNAVSASHGDERVPPAERCVIRPLLEQRAADSAEETYVVGPDGAAWTFASFRESVVRTANALRDLGVRHGDHVVSWLPNGMEALRLWFGLNYLGAVYVPINTAYRGSILQHVIKNADASLLVGHAALLPRLAEIDRTPLQQIVSIGRTGPELPGIVMRDASALSSESTTLPELERPIQPWDTQAIIYTSGTTGPSKGVLSSYMHLWASMSDAASFPYLTASDRFVINLPLFHVGSTLFIYAMLLRGGSVALVESFESSRFWEVVRSTGTTAGILLGVMAQFLLKQPPSPADREHPLRHVLMVPLTDDAELFAERFGVDVYTLFNMTETSIPIVSGKSPRPAGTCGRVRSGIEARLVDEWDCEVPVGTIGELILRTDAPWSMNHGYYKNPEATAAAWRNGWFHTGDAFRVDAEGNYYFVDRMKDAIRRRGENISSFEVEREICAFPAVKEAAVVAARGELSEDEVLAVVAPVPGHTIDPVELTRFLVERLPYFMVPRYIRVVPELPKTPTQKVQKADLRRDGLTPDIWDREMDKTVVVKRERLK